MSAPVLTPAETDQVVRAAFHAAWSEQVGQPGYNKAAWQHVQLFLDPAYRNQRTATVIPFKK